MFVIIVFTLIIIFGSLLSLVLSEKISLITRIGLSYLLGLGLFTFIIFCYSTLGLRISQSSIFISLVIINLLLILVIKILAIKITLKNVNLIKSIQKLSVIEILLSIFISVFCILTLIHTLYYPVTVWDALALYDFRAKIITEYGYFTQIANNYFYFSQYPLLTSLSHAIVYINGGKYPQIIYSMMYISFLFVFYGELREFTSKKNSLLFTLIMASVPVYFEHSTFAYTNLSYAIYISLSTIFMFIWIVKEKSLGYLIISGLLSGLSTWSRSAEPFWAVNLFILVFYCLYKYKKYILYPVWYSLSFFPIKWIWLKQFNNLSGDKSNYIGFISTEIISISNSIFKHYLDFNKIIEVIIYLYENVVKTWYPISVIFMVFVILNVILKIKKTPTLFLLFIIFHFALLVYGTYIMSVRSDYWLLIPDSARRMAMFFFPLMIFYIGISMNILIPNNKEKIKNFKL